MFAAHLYLIKYILEDYRDNATRFKSDAKSNVKDLKSNAKSDVNDFKSDAKSEVEKLKSDVKVLKRWMRIIQDGFDRLEAKLDRME